MAGKLCWIVWRCSRIRAERYQSPVSRPLKWRQRLPRTLYSKLTKQAENEGVSINSLVTAIIAEAIGAKQAR